MCLIVLTPDARNTQITVTIVMTLIVTCYSLSVRPFLEPIFNDQEIANEITVMLSGYVLYLYTEIV
jgi:hypothetical protein